MGLFKPAWMSKNEQKALAALAEVTDDARLYKAAMESPLYDVKLAAVKRIQDQALLFSVAARRTDPYLTNSYNTDIRYAATKRITDETILRQLALNCEDSTVRKVAANSITSQSILVHLLRESKDGSVRYSAISALNDAEDKFLFDIALHDESRDPSVRIVAARKLKTVPYLEKLALESRESDIRDICTKKLLGIYASFEPQERFTAEANSPIRQIRMHAVSLTDDQESIAAFVRNDKDRFVREEALEKLQDQVLLTELALKDEDSVIRNKAADRITDEATLEQLALTSEDWDSANGYAEKLQDAFRLARVCCGAKHPITRRTALEKLSSADITEDIVAYIIKHSQYDEAFTLLKELYKHREDMRPAIEKAKGKTYLAHTDRDGFISDCTRYHADSYQEQLFELK